MLLAVDTGLLGLPKPLDFILAIISAFVGLYLILHQVGEATEYFAQKRHLWPRIPRLARMLIAIVLLVIVPGLVWVARLQTAGERPDSTADSTADSGTVSGQVPRQSEADPSPPSPSKPAVDSEVTTLAPRPKRAVARLSAELIHHESGEDKDFYLVVRNTGTMPVKVWASLKVTEVQQFLGAREGQVYRGYWEAAQSPDADLAPAQWDRLVLGKIRLSPDTSKIYTVTHYKDGVRDSASDVWEFEGDYAGHGPRLKLTVTLESYPPMRPAELARGFLISSSGWEACSTGPGC